MANLPVVLLYEWGGSSERSYFGNGWISLLTAANRHPYAIDLPGQGSTLDWKAADMSDIVEHVMGYLPPGRVDIVGCSFGAKVALKMASQNPQRFRRIVCMGIGDDAFATSGSKGPGAMLRPEELQLLGPRTLVINGSLDDIAQPDTQLRAALPGLTYVLLLDLAHGDLISDQPVRQVAVRFFGLVDERESP